MRPHSEHSLSATRSLASVGWSMMKSWESGRAEEGGDAEGSSLSPSTLADPDPLAVSERDWAASWMSARAVTAFATTWHQRQQPTTSRHRFRARAVMCG
jgi:hypothetical protein